jgi:threonine dehydratase
MQQSCLLELLNKWKTSNKKNRFIIEYFIFYECFLTYNHIKECLGKKGIIEKIEGFDKIENDPSIFHISRRLFKGDKISEDMIGTESQVMARIYICCETKQELKNKILEIYNNDSLIIEPAGVLSLCGLDFIKEKNKNIICIISGGNSDVFRMNEIMERSLLYEGLKHYFQIEFKQKAGSLKDFILNIMNPNDNIIFFKYTRIINQETGPVIIGIETENKNDITKLINKMDEFNIKYKKLNYSELL